MSNRLKRKLGELGVDTSSAKANESFCLIGTPLPPLEKVKDKNEFVPLWKQEVRDEKGRRRLHGAFTGGFSAGYFNTVGSKEGWTPSTFVSSRSERAKQKASRPEDFMDEEDLQELREGRKLVDTTEEMDLTGGRQPLAEDAENDSIAKALASSLLPPPEDSAGARILKKMGWRLGQGIGPRLTYRQKRQQDKQLALGSGQSGDIANIPDDDEEASKHTYARRDTPILLVERKDNAHGLGYQPGMKLHETLGVRDSAAATGPRISAGFGLGALNDADEDDVDIYDHSTASKRRTAYDISDRDEDDHVITRRTASKMQTMGTRSAQSFTFSNGLPVLPGFVLSDKPVAEDRWFPIPEVPKGWAPDPRRVWNQYQDKENEPIPPKAQPGQKQWRTTITADERGTMLGETPLPSAPRSVFEYMSQKDRERMQRITTAIAEGRIVDSGLPKPSATSDSIRIPRTEPHIAEAALKGFQPFSADPQKQQRYHAYLQSQSTQDSSVAPKPRHGQSIDEFNKEMEDYAKAALIFKPMSGAMAGRFTSASVVEQGPKVYEGLHTPTTNKTAKEEVKEETKEEENISPKANAARMGMYGPLTREVKPWQPARLLCKRFGVKDPAPDMSTEGTVGALVAQTTEQAPPQGSTSATPSQEIPQTESAGRRDLSNVGLGEDETQGQDTLTYQRPTMDVFKAIFASDDEDSDDEPEAKDNMPDEETPVAEIPQAKAPERPTIATDHNGSASSDVTSTPLDLATFKPTFIPRDKRLQKDQGSQNLKEGKEKKRKEKKAILVSFEVDEDRAEVSSSKGRPKKKKRKEKARREDENDEGMWIEKPVPEIVKHLPTPPLDVSPSASGKVDALVGPPKGRKRAIDFM